MRSAVLLAAAAALGGCLSSPDYDDTPPDVEPRDLDAIRQKSQLDNALSGLAGCNCVTTITPRMVRVVVHAGSKGLPDAALLKRMSERIVEVAGIDPRQHLITTSAGVVLFVNGAPVSRPP
jgi:hypothetical protein